MSARNHRRPLVAVGVADIRYSAARLVECQPSGATQVGPMIGPMSAIADFDMGVAMAAMALHVCLSLSYAIAVRAVRSMATFVS